MMQTPLTVELQSSKLKVFFKALALVLVALFLSWIIFWSAIEPLVLSFKWLWFLLFSSFLYSLLKFGFSIFQSLSFFNLQNQFYHTLQSAQVWTFLPPNKALIETKTSMFKLRVDLEKSKPKTYWIEFFLSSQENKQHFTKLALFCDQFKEGEYEQLKSWLCFYQKQHSLKTTLRT